MLLCVVFRLQVGQVQFVRLRDVNEEQKEDHGHSQRVDTETECVDTVTDVCLCSDYAAPSRQNISICICFLRQKYLPNTFPFFPGERRFTIIFPRCSQHDEGPGPGPGDSRQAQAGLITSEVRKYLRIIFGRRENMYFLKLLDCSVSLL